MNTRLKQFMAAENITQSQLADNLDVVRASVSHILAGRNKPSYEFIKALMMHYPKLNMEWLMFGKGKMYITPQPIADPQPTPTIQTSPSQNDDEVGIFSADEMFPDDIPLPSSSDSHVQPSKDTNTEISTDINTLGNLKQVFGGQRKVVKVAIFFDDGTYQEL